MISFKRLAIPALVLSAALYSAGTLTAYASDHDKTPPPGHEHEHPANPAAGDDPHLRMANDLKLTDKQRAAFQDILKQRMDNMRQMHEVHEQLHDMVESEHYDEAKAKDLLQKSSADMQANVLKNAKAMHEFYLSLNDEQRAKLKKMHDDMKSRMRGRLQEHLKGRMHGGPDDEDDAP